ncbi:hypothetical protein [Herbiconiux sp. L3-i23]|uniref:hypothetical protein n=1 Tax=Herbiconiux sp. L3-i23 TaxID=2905871 RepID=UPI00206B0E12|nr:hypothetical protein [Herbiconiux sp. L3-i23]BDI23689.1 hypothetical protein L3i23_24650 [Herbiconiux sp. L3-i23]
MTSCTHCGAGVVYRFRRSTASATAGYAYVCIARDDHFWFEARADNARLSRSA